LQWRCNPAATTIAKKEGTVGSSELAPDFPHLAQHVRQADLPVGQFGAVPDDPERARETQLNENGAG
jgi:hypothetical protein